LAHAYLRRVSIPSEFPYMGGVLRILILRLVLPCILVCQVPAAMRDDDSPTHGGADGLDAGDLVLTSDSPAEQFQYSIFVVAYKLDKFPLVGIFAFLYKSLKVFLWANGVFHTSVLVCSGSGRTVKVGASGCDDCHDCAEMLFDRDVKGVWRQGTPMKWNGVTLAQETHFVGNVRTPFDSVDAFVDHFIQWGQKCEEQNPRTGLSEWLDFNVGTYHLLNHNCNYFTYQVVLKLRFDGAKHVRQYAPESAKASSWKRKTLEHLVWLAFKAAAFAHEKKWWPASAPRLFGENASKASKAIFGKDTTVDGVRRWLDQNIFGANPKLSPSKQCVDAAKEKT